MRLLIGVCFAAAVVFAPAIAAADPGRANASVNVRAGPDIAFPGIATLARGASIEVRGCIASRQWCDVSSGRVRGWVSARYLDINVGGRQGNVWNNRTRVQLPTLSWNIDSYWDTNYSGRDFNRQRETYRRRGPQTQAQQTDQRQAQRPADQQSQRCENGREPGPQGCGESSQRRP